MKQWKIFFVGFLTYCSAGSAQVLPVIPNSVLPGRVQESIQQEQGFARKKPATIDSYKPAAAAGVPAAEKITFKLKKIIIKGATVYSKKTLLGLFPHQSGDKVSIADIEKYTAAITDYYRRNGYILSQAILPPQVIDEGTITVQVIEGYIEHVAIKGDCKANNLLQRYAQQIEKSRPLNMAVLERYALLANDIPGMNVKTVISPSPKTAGAAELTLVAEQQMLDGYFNYDNRGTRYLGPQQMLAGIGFNGLLFGSDSTDIKAFTSGDLEEVQYLALSHDEIVGHDGLIVSTDLETTRSHPGYTLSTLDLKGTGNTATIDLKYPFLRSRAKNLYLHSSAIYMNSSTNILSTTPLYRDRTRSLVVGMSYDAIDNLRGMNLVTLDVAQGFNVMNASQRTDLLSRPKGRVAYSKVTGEIARIQSLTQRFSCQLSSTGQYALMPLLATQQFGFGGSNYGRGYDPAIITGDRGVAGKFELRYDAEPNLSVLNSVQFFTFYDAGVVWALDHTNYAARQAATSTGGGVRINLAKNLMASLEVDKPLSRKVSEQNSERSTTMTYFTLMLKL